MLDYVTQLESAVETTWNRLAALSIEQVEWRPSPGAWSIKEVIGHLIDSASNNHERFVRARWKDDLRFAGYEQDAWIAAQNYQDAPFGELLDLWRLFNRHIVRIMASTPEDIRMKPHNSHNFHEIAWKTVPTNTPVTLDYFMRDYVGHLVHHVAQIESILGRSNKT